VVEEDKPYDIEYRIVRKDGAIRAVRSRASVERDPAGRPVRMLGALQDITEREQTEEQLRALSARHEAILAEVPDIIAEVDANKVYTWINQAGLEFFGPDVLGKEAAFYFEGAQDTYKIVEPLFNGSPRVFYLESWQRRRDGEKRLLAWWCRALVDAEGKVTGALSTARDITERKKAEATLLASETRYRTIFEQAGDYVLMLELGPDGIPVITDANEAALLAHGYSREELLGKPISLLDPELTPETNAERVRIAREAGGLFPVRHRRKNGSFFDAEVRAKALPLGAKTVFLTVERDITERKRAEEALRESECFFRESQRVAFIGSYQTDFTAGRWKSSETLDHIFGIDKRYDRSVQGWLEIVHPDDREMMGQYLKDEVIGKRKLFDKEYRIIRKSDGETRWVHGLGRVDFDAQGNLLSMIGTIQDVTERKRMEEALREETAIAQTFMDALPCVALLLKPGTREIVALNKAAREAGAQLGATCFGSWPKFDKACWFCRAPQAWETGTPQTLEVEALGTVWEAHWVPVTKELYLHYALDITEHKRAEDALRQAKEYAETLIQTANVMIVGLDTAGNVTVFNDAAETICGYTRAELEGKNWFEVLVPKDKYPYVWKEFTRLLEGGLPKTFENPILTKSGEERHISWQNSELFEKGGIAGTISFGVDVTERKRAEKRLQESEEKYRALFDNSTDGIVVHQLTPDGSPGRFLAANDALCKMLGYSREEMLVLSPRELDSPAWAQTAVLDAAQLKAQGRTRLEIEMKRKDGRMVPVEINACLVVLNGETAILSNVRDITERKRAQMEVQRHQEELRRVSRLSTLGEMASGFAHELNQPLSAILSYVSASQRSIQAQDTDSERLIKNLDQVVSQAKRAGEIIKRVRAFAQRRPVRVSTIDVNEIVREVLAFVRSDVVHKEVEVALELGEGLPLVPADAIQLQQVLVNLVRNAIEAMETTEPQDRRLTIRTSLAAPGTVKVAVSDRGVGLDPAVLPLLFNPFFTTKAQGLGVGLAISRSIVEMHKGQLWAEPGRGRGCTFAFTLPTGQHNHKEHHVDVPPDGTSYHKNGQHDIGEDDHA